MDRCIRWCEYLNIVRRKPSLGIVLSQLFFHHFQSCIHLTKSNIFIIKICSRYTERFFLQFHEIFRVWDSMKWKEKKIWFLDDKKIFPSICLSLFPYHFHLVFFSDAPINFLFICLLQKACYTLFIKTYQYLTYLLPFYHET